MTNVEKSQALLIKRIFQGLIVVSIAMAMAWALLPKPVEADIAPIAHMPLRVTVDEEGKSRIRDVFVITAPVSGTLRRIALKSGDPVVKNETVIASILPPPPAFRDFRTSLELESQVKSCEANVQLADAEFKQAVSELQLAKSEFDRAQSLARKGVASAATLEKSEANLRAREAFVARAKAAIEVRKRELDSARIRLLGPEQSQVRQAVDSACTFEVRSPESGRVLKIIAQSEQTLAIGAPVLEIGNPGNLEIAVDLLSADAVKIRPGAKATIDGWGGPPLAAKVTNIEPSGFTKVSSLGIEEQRVKAILEIAEPAETWQRLGHDYRVFVKIDAYTTDSALAVPLGALFRRGESWYVFVYKDGRARAQPLKIGQRNASIAEVLSGMTAGERVILHPSDRISDGVRVRERLSGSMGK